MTANYPPSLERLIKALGRLPGVGPKTAQRLAFYLLNVPYAEAKELADAIINAREKVKFCSVCGNFSEEEICPICRDTSRDQSIICVVEEARDVNAIEKTGGYNGLYHVLQGVLIPSSSIGPDDLNIAKLVERIKQNKDIIKEVIIATGASSEGETTAMYLAKILFPLGVKVSRIAYGLPVGGDLEYVDDITLAKALEGRRDIV